MRLSPVLVNAHLATCRFVSQVLHIFALLFWFSRFIWPLSTKTQLLASSLNLRQTLLRVNFHAVNEEFLFSLYVGSLKGKVNVTHPSPQNVMHWHKRIETNLICESHWKGLLRSSRSPDVCPICSWQRSWIPCARWWVKAAPLDILKYYVCRNIMCAEILNRTFNITINLFCKTRLYVSYTWTHGIAKHNRCKMSWTDWKVRCKLF